MSAALDHQVEDLLCSTQGLRHGAESGVEPTAELITLTSFKRDNDVNGLLATRTVSKLIDIFSNPKVFPSKKAMPLFAPAEFLGGTRAKGKTVLKMHAVVGEHDAGKVSIQSAVDRASAAGLLAIFYTTPSHTPEHPKWRVVCPVIASIAPTDYFKHLNVLNSILGGCMPDECWQLARCWYYGRVEGSEYLCAVSTGNSAIDYLVSVGKFLESIGKAAAEPNTSVFEFEGESVPLDVVCAALSAIDVSNGLDYQDWLQIIFGVKAANVDAFEILQDWNAGNPKERNDGALERCWNDADPAGEIQFDYVSKRARQDSPDWVDPQILNLFGVIPDEVVDERTNKFVPRSISEIVDRAPMRWLIKGLMPQAELGVVYGPPGAGKTFVVLDMAMALARGVAYREMRVPEARRVVYVAGEGVGGLGQRVRAYLKHNDLLAADVENFSIVEVAPSLLRGGDAKQLAAAIGSADLIIVDTLARSMAGGDENSSEDMGAALQNAKELHKATGATVLLVHHSGKDVARGARGWSGLKGAADFELAVARDDKTPEFRTLAVTKQKDGGEIEPLGFALLPVQLGVDDDGDPVSSCVVLEAQAPAPERKPSGKWQQLICDCIDGFAIQGPDGWVDIETVIQAAIDDVVPDEGKADRRRDNAKRALVTLVSTGLVIQVESKVRR